MFSSAFEDIGEGQLPLSALRHELRGAISHHRQPWGPGRPMVAPQLRRQLAMNWQLAKLTPSQLHPAGLGAVATAAAAGAVAHGWLQEGST